MQVSWLLPTGSLPHDPPKSLLTDEDRADPPHYPAVNRQHSGIQREDHRWTRTALIAWQEH